MIRILHKLPGLANGVTVREIEPTLSAMQEMVTPTDSEGRALIELVRIGALQEQGIDLYVNEEGKFNGCKPNFQIYGGRDVVMGPAFFVASDEEGEMAGLSDAQLSFAQGWINEQPWSVF